eukprot:14111883-Heterocapsa_arctica.AAC.1
MSGPVDQAVELSQCSPEPSGVRHGTLRSSDYLSSARQSGCTRSSGSRFVLPIARVHRAGRGARLFAVLQVDRHDRSNRYRGHIPPKQAG